MSEWIIRNIDIDLSHGSIRQAIREIEEIQAKLPYAMWTLVDHFAKKGVEIARAELIFFADPAYYTGELSESVRYSMEGNNAIIAAGNDGEGAPGYYAAYVEYGTGIYDTKYEPNHGEEGWVYLNKRDSKFYWTNGMPPRPFMQHTYEGLIQEIEAEGGRILAEYLA